MNILLIFVIVILCIVNLFLLYKICNHKRTNLNYILERSFIEEFQLPPLNFDSYYTSSIIENENYIDIPGDEINDLFLHMFTCFNILDTSFVTTDQLKTEHHDLNEILKNSLDVMNKQLAIHSKKSTSSATDDNPLIGIYLKPNKPVDVIPTTSSNNISNKFIYNNINELDLNNLKVRPVNIKKKQSLKEDNDILNVFQRFCCYNSLILLNIRFTFPNIVKDDIIDKIDCVLKSNLTLNCFDVLIANLIERIPKEIKQNIILKNHFVKELVVIFSEYLFLKLQTWHGEINYLGDYNETINYDSIIPEKNLFHDHIKLVLFLHKEAQKIKFEDVKVQFYTFLFYSFIYGKDIFKTHITKLNSKDIDTKHIIHKFFDNYEFEGLYKLFILGIVKKELYYSDDDEITGDDDITRFGLHYEFIEENKDLLELNSNDYINYYQNINYLKVHFFDKKSVYSYKEIEGELTINELEKCYNYNLNEECKRNEKCIWSNNNNEGRCAIKPCSGNTDNNFCIKNIKDNHITDRRRILYTMKEDEIIIKDTSNHFMKNFININPPQNYFSIQGTQAPQYSNDTNGCLDKSDKTLCLNARNSVGDDLNKCKYSKNNKGCYSEDLLESQCSEYDEGFDWEGCNKTKHINIDNKCFWNFNSEKCFNLDAPISWINKNDKQFIGSTDAQSCINFKDEDSCYDKRCVWSPVNKDYKNVKCIDKTDLKLSLYNKPTCATGAVAVATAATTATTGASETPLNLFPRDCFSKA